MTHRNLNGKCSENLQDTFIKRSRISSYSIRNSQDLHLTMPLLGFTTSKRYSLDAGVRFPTKSRLQSSSIEWLSASDQITPPKGL